MAEKHYDRDGRYQGYTDDRGKHYDRDGRYQGYTDDRGRRYDRDGRYAGRSDDRGRHYDRDGRYEGRTDDNRHYDRDGRYSGRSEEKSGCFLSTACLQEMGLPDDCRELQVLRRFRDDYVQLQPGGPALVAEYYALAPSLTAAIQKQRGSRQLLKRVYEELVVPCVGLIESDRPDEAMVLYRGYFGRLQTSLGRDAY